MRILHAESSINWGGQEYRALEQIEWLQENGHEAFLAARSGSDIIERAHRKGLTVFVVNYKGHYDPRAILKARTIIKKHRIDIADCHGSRDVMTFSFARSLIPVIRTRHVSQSIKNKFHRRLQWRYGSDHIIATAACIREEILTKGLAPTNKISIVGEWAADSFFDISKKSVHRASIRQEFNVPEGVPLICVVGMLRGDKAQEVLIETVAEMKRRGRAVVGLIVGAVTNSQSDYDQKLKNLANDRGVTGDIRFAGYREDVPRLTQGSDAQLLTSISVEAQSRTIPQAFASCTPVIASKVGGVAELISDAERGYLVEIRDVAGYADALCRLFDQPEKAVGIVETARSYAQEHLRLDGKMEETLAIYRSQICKDNL